jgi:hypothetical protein
MDERLSSLIELSFDKYALVLTMDDLLYLSNLSTHEYVDPESAKGFNKFLERLARGFDMGLYDSLIFDDYTINVAKIKLIISRLDLVVADWDSCIESFDLPTEVYPSTIEERLPLKQRQHNRKIALRWRRESNLIYLINQMAMYCPELEFNSKSDTNFRNKRSEDESDEVIIKEGRDNRRTNSKAPTNQERIKALKYLAPELWDKLQKIQDKSTQQDVIHLITGVNKVDSYKYSFGDRQKQVEERDIPNLTDLVNKLTQS